MAKLSSRPNYDKNAIIQEMLCMRNGGKNYSEIAQHFNISKQRVYQLIGNSNPSFFRHIQPTGCIYKGVRKWMNDNKVSVTEMTRRIYGNYNPCSYSAVRNRLCGLLDMNKKHIDKILQITGLTYEVAFELESEV